MKSLTKASILLTCLCMTFTSILYGQTTIPNGGFETWTGSGNTMEPTNWNGNKTGGGNAPLGPQTCFQEATNPHSGTYCMKLENGNLFGTAVNATGTTGKIEAPTFSPADGYIRTVTADPDFNAPFTGRPDSLVGWFRFTQGGSDIGRVQAILHDNYDYENPDQGSSASHKIAEAIYDVPNGSTANWTRFAVPFNYTSSATPNYILLIATASSTVGSASTSTIFWVDDLSVVYCSEATETLTETACNSYTSPSGKVWTSSNTYMDTLSNVAGVSQSCDSVFTINLTINTADASVTDNGTFLQANATGATYQWVDCNNGNAPIVGETNAIFTPTVTGNYAVEVTENGCTVGSACYNVTVVGINQLAFDNQLSLYPNPNNGEFTIDLGADYNDVTLVITDVNGKVVYNTNYAQSNLMKLNLDQPAGIYFVSVTSETKHAVLKLIKQ